MRQYFFRFTLTDERTSELRSAHRRDDSVFRNGFLIERLEHRSTPNDRPNRSDLARNLCVDTNLQSEARTHARTWSSIVNHLRLSMCRREVYRLCCRLRQLLVHIFGTKSYKVYLRIFATISISIWLLWFVLFETCFVLTDKPINGCCLVGSRLRRPQNHEPMDRKGYQGRGIRRACPAVIAHTAEHTIQSFLRPVKGDYVGRSSERQSTNADNLVVIGRTFLLWPKIVGCATKLYYYFCVMPSLKSFFEGFCTTRNKSQV